MKNIFASLGLVLALAGCGNRAGTPADMAQLVPDWGGGLCPAPGPSTLEHWCNSSSGGGCSYRDTKLACIAYCFYNQDGQDNPVGCVGHADFGSVLGMRDYICVKSCGDCQPADGAS